MKKIIGILKFNDITKEVELSQEFYERYRILQEFAEMCLDADDEKIKGDFSDNELEKQYYDYYGGKYSDSLIEVFENAFDVQLYSFSDDLSYHEEDEKEVRIYLTITSDGNKPLDLNEFKEWVKNNM